MYLFYCAVIGVFTLCTAIAVEPTGIQTESNYISSSKQQHQQQHTKSEDPPLSTIDENEINFHANLTEWWTESRQSLNPFRIKLIREILASRGQKEVNDTRYLEGLKVLDVGCGGGILSEALAKAGAQVTGLDPTENLIRIAKEHAALDKNLTSNLSYVHSTIENFAAKNKDKYDLVIVSEVLEHVLNQEFFLKNCIDTLKPNGSILVTTINKTYFSWLYVVILLEDVLKVVPKGNHDWNKFIAPEETRAILNKHGCEIKFTRGLFWNPFTYDWPEISSLSSFYAVHAIKHAKEN